MAMTEERRLSKRLAARRRYASAEGRALHRERVLRSRYGISGEDVRLLYELQEGCCAICGAAGDQPYVSDQRETGSKETLRLDHDHQTGEVRGLLCNLCNSALGKFGDSPRLLILALAYLAQWEEGSSHRH